MSNNKSSSGGTSVFTVLLVVFVVLKLCGVKPIANWSWWWVLAPLWIPLALAAILFMIVGLIYAITRKAK